MKMKKLFTLGLLLMLSGAASAVDTLLAPIIIAPTIIGGTSTVTVPAANITGTVGVAQGGTNNTAFTATALGCNPVLVFDGTKLFTDTVASDFCYNPTTNALYIGAISGTQLTSTIATGTAPLVVASTTPVANLVAGGNVPQTSATGSAVMPSGTTAQRDGTPAVGYQRYNSTLGVNEYWGGAAWETLVDAPLLNAGTLPISGTTIAASGQLTSTLATGTAPLVVASTTNVANLNASSLNGATMAAPGTIGGTTAGAAFFTNVDSTSSNSGQLGGFRNKLINGDFPISQVNANAAVTVTAGAALQYTIDQWYAYSIGGNVTAQRIAGTGNEQYRYQITGGASVTAVGFGQRIEQANSYHLAGTQTAICADLSDSLLTTVTWTAYYANTPDTFGTLAAPTHTQIATGNFTVNSTLSRYCATMAMPAAATTGIEIVFTVGTQTSGTLVFDEIQWEQVSATATQGTAFERVALADQALHAKRYLRTWAYPAGGYAIANGMATTTYSGVATGLGGDTSDMRVTPTLTSSAAAAFNVMNANGAAVALTGFALSANPGGPISASYTVTAGLTAGNAAVLLSSPGTAATITAASQL